MHSEIVSEYDQEIPLSQTADKPMSLGGRAHNNHETLGRQIKKNNQLSFFHIKMIAEVCVHIYAFNKHIQISHISVQS